MVQVTFDRMMETFFKFLGYSWITIIILIIVIGIAFVFYTTNNVNKQQSRNLYVIMYLVIIVAVIIMNFENLHKFSDYILDHFFVALYFPNVVIYGFVVLATNIITLRSVFNQHVDKGLRLLNIIAFSLIHYLLILALIAIADNGIDIFNEVAVYENVDLLSLVQLSMYVFATWMLLLMTYYGLRKINQVSRKKPNLIDSPSLMVNQLEQTPNIKMVDQEPTTWRGIIPPNAVLKEDRKKEEIINPNDILEQKIENKLNTQQLVDDKFTKDEYRIMLEILKRVNKK